MLFVNVGLSASHAQGRSRAFFLRWHVNQYAFTQNNTAGSVACTIIALLFVENWLAYTGPDFMNRWLQQDYVRPAAWTALMQEGSRLMTLYLQDVVPAQESNLQAALDRFCIPDEVAHELLEGKLASSSDPGWSKLRHLCSRSSWRMLTCGATLHRALQTIWQHRASLPVGQRAAFVIVCGNKSSVVTHCGHVACSMLYSDSHCFSAELPDSSVACVVHDAAGLESFMCRGGENRLYRPEEQAIIFAATYPAGPHTCCEPPDLMPHGCIHVGGLSCHIAR